MSTSTDTLEAIRSSSHWKVGIHLQKAADERIATLDEYADAIRESQVRLDERAYPYGGWPYPHLGYRNLERGADWIASCVETFEERRECWRFYQSGMFVHHFGFWEDRPSWRSEIEERYRNWGLTAAGFSPNGFLDVDIALWTFTAIFEFTACLMATGVIGARDEASVVKIGMYQIRDRALSATLLRMVDPLHQVTKDYLEHSWRVVGPGIHDEAAKQAREATRWFLNQFGMKTTDDMLKPDQEKMLGRQLYA